jgi:hypothetical protein
MHQLTDEEVNKIGTYAQEMLDEAHKLHFKNWELAHACLILLDTLEADPKAVAHALEDIKAQSSKLPTNRVLN